MRLESPALRPVLIGGGGLERSALAGSRGAGPRRPQGRERSRRPRHPRPRRGRDGVGLRAARAPGASADARGAPRWRLRCWPRRTRSSSARLCWPWPSCPPDRDPAPQARAPGRRQGPVDPRRRPRGARPHRTGRRSPSCSRGSTPTPSGGCARPSPPRSAPRETRSAWESCSRMLKDEDARVLPVRARGAPRGPGRRRRRHPAAPPRAPGLRGARGRRGGASRR